MAALEMETGSRLVQLLEQSMTDEPFIGHMIMLIFYLYVEGMV